MAALYRLGDAERRALVLEGPALGAIALLGAPAALMGAVQALAPFVDSLFVYNAAGLGPGASVAFVGPIVAGSGAFGVGLGAAGLALIGQANGSGDAARARSLARQFLVLTLAAGFVAALLLLAAMPLLVSPLESGLRDDAKSYLSLSALGLPLTYFASAYNALAAARGRTEKPLFRSLIGLLAKAVWDAVFVLLLGLGAAGAGWAGLASGASVAVFMALDLRRESRARGLETPFRLEGKVVRTLLVLGLPQALVQASNSISFYIMNGEAAAYGRNVLNGYSIANATNSLFFAPVTALGTAAAASTAIASGAGRPERARRICDLTLVLGALGSVLLAAFLLPAARPLVSLFSRDESVLGYATDAMRVFSISILGFAVFNIVSSAFSGVGRAEVPLAIALLRIWVLRVPSVLLLSRIFPSLGEYSIWLSMAVSNFGTAGAALLWYRRLPWSRRILGGASLAEGGAA